MSPSAAWEEEEEQQQQEQRVDDFDEEGHTMYEDAVLNMDYDEHLTNGAMDFGGFRCVCGRGAPPGRVTVARCPAGPQALPGADGGGGADRALTTPVTPTARSAGRSRRR